MKSMNKSFVDEKIQWIFDIWSGIDQMENLNRESEVSSSDLLSCLSSAAAPGRVLKILAFFWPSGRFLLATNMYC